MHKSVRDTLILRTSGALSTVCQLERCATLAQQYTTVQDAEEIAECLRLIENMAREARERIACRGAVSVVM